MFGFGMIIAVIAVVMAVLGIIIAKDDVDSGMPFVVIAFFIAIIGGFINILTNQDQITNIENITYYKSCIAISQERIDNQLPLITKELRGYSKYESDTIINSLKGKGALVAFPPELKANTTVIESAKEIKSAYDKIYDYKMKIEESKQEIRIRNRSTKPWIVYLIEAPTELTK